MRHLFILIFLTFTFQCMYAKYEVYYDQYGNMQKGEVSELSKLNPTVVNGQFKQIADLKRKSNQVIVATIESKTISTSSGLKCGKQYKLFEVIESDDSSLVGKPVVCQVLETRKSNILGSEGRLTLRPLYIEKDGIQIPLIPNDIHRRGLNRTNVKFWTSILIIPVFVAGSRAEIKPEEDIVLTLE